MKLGQENLPSGERGMALLMVLWITAALGIIVASVSYMVRAEVRYVASMREAAVARATARAAVVLLLQELRASSQRRLDRPQAYMFTFNGVAVNVLAAPLNGLIDLNQAPAPLLTKVFESTLGLDLMAAQALALSIVEKRTARGPSGGVVLFDAVEDLLEVPGLDYELYARLAPLVTANTGGDGKINPYAAPEPLLVALAAGNHAAVTAFMAARESSAGDLSSFDQAFLTSSGATRLRVQVQIPKGDGGLSQVNCDASLVGQRVSATPWSIQQCDYQTSSN